MDQSRAPGLREYSLADLKIATNNLRTVLGQGSFRYVYKGFVDEMTLAPSKGQTGKAVAIKISMGTDKDSEVFEQWQSEINFVGRYYHPNLISLLGFCWDTDCIGLVYEFMEKGDLGRHLFHRHGTMKPLSWNMRLKIAIGAGRGLAFLHSLEKKIIHQLFNSANILLDENYNVKLGDFSLAIRGPREEELPIVNRSTIQTTHNCHYCATYLDYCAPEILLKGNVYIKSDVYSFGVVLLQLWTGLQSIDRYRPDGEQSLVDWLDLKLSNQKNLETIMDEHMKGQYSIEAAFQAAELTKKCLDMNPANRPNTKQVVEELKQIQEMEEERKSSKNQTSTLQR